MVACSYFQYEEYPAFMTFFYTVYFTFIIGMSLWQVLQTHHGQRPSPA